MKAVVTLIQKGRQPEEVESRLNYATDMFHTLEEYVRHTYEFTGEAIEVRICTKDGAIALHLFISYFSIPSRQVALRHRILSAFDPSRSYFPRHVSSHALIRCMDIRWVKTLTGSIAKASSTSHHHPHYRRYVVGILRSHRQAGLFHKG